MNPPWSDFDWQPGAGVLKADADGSLNEVFERLKSSPSDWVALTHQLPDSNETDFYAVTLDELEGLLDDPDIDNTIPIREVLQKMGWSPGIVLRNGRLTVEEAPAAADPTDRTSTRVVDLDPEGDVVRVGMPTARKLRSPPFRRGKPPAAKPRVDIQDYISDLLGPTRGIPQGSGQPPPPAPSAPAVEAPAATAVAPTVDLTLSAQTQSQVNVGSSVPVLFRIELAAGADPLATSIQAVAAADKPVKVSLTVENDALILLGKREFTFDPVVDQYPWTGKFMVAGNHVGSSRLAVTFQQGGTTLGVIGLSIGVLEEGAAGTPRQGEAKASARDLADDDKLALLIEERICGNNICYDYILHSEGLRLDYRKASSKPFQDRAGGFAKSMTDFVNRIYTKLTPCIRSKDDVTELQRQARSLGILLCTELFDPDVTRILWPLREKIQLIQIVSWEPYIPWELVCMQHPDTGEVDGRFLAEYGVVRTLSDISPPRDLVLDRWSYLAASYPCGSLPHIGREIEFFTSPGPGSLRARNLTPRAIGPERKEFYAAVAAPDFDVFHICCHADSDHESIDTAELIIGDEKPPGEAGPRRITVDATNVAAEARLAGAHPLVFLNGCETGRIGPVLTQYGGWPNVFLRAGAGAFVGTSWSVRDVPASEFCKAFYNALLDGKMLFEAATAARAACKKLGDASWLAYKVYGHPRAQLKKT
ncbi:MAG TPA: CHAT domain-containing protein [Steroidobacteraceae bacterium]|nr:CHAT domain-containing protein [Steroidobacteraceae bacterium]